MDNSINYFYDILNGNELSKKEVLNMDLYGKYNFLEKVAVYLLENEVPITEENRKRFQSILEDEREFPIELITSFFWGLVICKRLQNWMLGSKIIQLRILNQLGDLNFQNKNLSLISGSEACLETCQYRFDEPIFENGEVVAYNCPCGIIRSKQDLNPNHPFCIKRIRKAMKNSSSENSSKGYKYWQERLRCIFNSYNFEVYDKSFDDRIIRDIINLKNEED
jgi:hypothetical protein